MELLDRALAAVPPGVEQVATRWDASYFAGELAQARLVRDVRFAIGAKRKSAVVRAGQAVGDHEWTPAFGMEHSEVAVIDYRPKGWPEAVRCIARRTRIPVGNIPTEAARKRRTIPKDQLTLALDGHLDAVYGYSFI